MRQTCCQQIGLKRSEATAELRFKPVLTEAKIAGLFIMEFQ